jgi:HEAT repeat protein
MTDVEKYLEDLKGPSKNKRFDACYYLKRMKDIPEDAVLALQEAANDSDFLVAREARKALQAHSLPIKTVAMIQM